MDKDIHIIIQAYSQFTRHLKYKICICSTVTYAVLR